MIKQTDRLQDQSKIISVILRWAYALDQKNWTLAGSCFSNEIETDYSDLRGGTFETVSADAFVEKRKEALTHLKTLHMNTNHLVEFQRFHAVCTSNFIIHRQDPTLEKENTFDSYGHYFHTLKKFNGEWKIIKVRQQLLWNIGNPKIHSGTQKSN